MDEQRFQQLTNKRDSRGLTDDEANELGRMMAEKEGKPYANAQQGVGGADPQKERALGDEREPVGPAPGGYVPPKGGREAGAPESPPE